MGGHSSSDKPIQRGEGSPRLCFRVYEIAQGRMTPKTTLEELEDRRMRELYGLKSNPFRIRRRVG